MAKKKEEEPKFEIITHLNKSEYIEWQSAINELKLTKKDQQVIDLEQKLLAKEVEIAQLKASLFTLNSVIQQKKKVEEKEKAYRLVKEKIEGRIGYSLNGKSINEFTMEILTT